MGNDMTSVGPNVIAALKRALAQGNHRVYLPWYSDSKRPLEEIAAALNLVLLSGSGEGPIPDDARGLRALIQGVVSRCGAHPNFQTHEERLSMASHALGEWPETEKLRASAIGRIRSALEACGMRGFLLFCPHRLPGMFEWQTRAIQLAEEIVGRSGQVIVAGNTAPAVEHVSAVRITWQDFRQDVASVGEKVLSVQDPRIRSPRRLIQEFLAFLERLVTVEKPKRLVMPPSAPESVARIGDGLSGRAGSGSPKSVQSEQEPRWFSLVARVFFPDTSRVMSTFSAWEELQHRAGILLHLDPTDRQILIARGRFLILLRERHPDVYLAALNDLDGADQLYKVHLVLCGHAEQRAALSGVLLPFWAEKLKDVMLRELFFDCFGVSAREQPLVLRFESRTQLSKHLAWQSNAQVSPNSDAQEQRIRGEFRAWVAQVSSELRGCEAAPESPKDPAKDREVKAVTAAPETFRKILRLIDDCSDLDSADALEFAQILMSGYELFADGVAEQTLGRDLATSVEGLLDSALSRSQGALRFEATLLLARLLAVRGDSSYAKEAVRVLRRTHHDEFAITAIEIEEAFLLERHADYIGARQAYQQALKAAERISADELSARAVLGQLRCSIMGSFKARDDGRESREQQLRRLRAQAMVQVQEARAPELAGVGLEQRLFVSYRSSSRMLSNKIVSAFSAAPERIAAWSDQRIKDCEDFLPTIHRELLSCGAMLLILGPSFFESKWCIHELHFALGQNDQRGLPLFWLWYEEQPQPAAENGASKVDDPEKDPYSDAMSRWKETWLPLQKDPGHERFHLEECLDRIVRKGTCLRRQVLRYTKPSPPEPDEPLLKEDEFEWLLKPIRELLGAPTPTQTHRAA